MRIKHLTALIAGGLLALVCSRVVQAACTLERVVELPVTMQGGHPIVSAQFNGHDVQLIADSGAFFSMISDAAAAQYDLPTAPASMGLRVTGVGGSVDAQIATVDTLGLVGGKLNRMEFLVGGTDVGVAGMLGRNVLNVVDAEYDFGDGAIRLFKPKGCGSQDLAYWSRTIMASRVPMGWADGVLGAILVDVKVNGVMLRAMIDSGSSASVIALRSARRAGIDVKGDGVVMEGMGGGIGRHAVRVWTAPINVFEIGGEKITNTHLQVMDTDFSDSGVDMLIGDDFLLSHRVYIANNQHKVYFTYQGGPIFNTTHHVDVFARSQAVAAIDDPKAADGFSRRGMAYAARGGLDLALADLDKAVALDPKTPLYYYQRSGLRLRLKEPAQATQDLDAALALKPDYVEARLARGRARFKAGDKPGASDDLAAAAKALAPEAELQLAVASGAEELGRYDEAVADYDQWIRYHPEDLRLGVAVNGRCWARALADRALDRALADCNRAVRLTDAAPNVLDSRGLVHLRRGEDAQALADYDAALKADPKIAWSHYGRGLLELKAGRTDAGRADILEAEMLDPKLIDLAKSIGLPPPAGLAPPQPLTATGIIGAARAAVADAKAQP